MACDRPIEKQDRQNDDAAFRLPRQRFKAGGFYQMVSMPYDDKEAL